MPARSRIDINTINALVKVAQYAVRGPIIHRAAELAAQLKQPHHGLPFNKIISCNIGNPQALEQKPISFVRDVLSLVINPSLKNMVSFPTDVVERAEKYLRSIPNIGAYTESQGILAVREEICQFLFERDGFDANVNEIFLTNGASEGVRLCMNTILRDPGHGFKDGILAPIPQYPLYSAMTTLLEGCLVPYYLDESNGWNCSIESLKESLENARKDGICVRALVIINPGNPTSQVLSEKNMQDIINWCKQEHICLMADEVYQENIWRPGSKFVSFRKVAHDLGAIQGEDGLQMVSFHSTSKGFSGECGLRGGYFELNGFPADVRQEIYKIASIALCSNTIGQITTGLMVQPPKIGDPSYEKYIKERDDILLSMRRRAEMLSAALNQLEGVSCNNIDGAMYAFPTISLPAKAIATAERKGIAADLMYCLELLENTGITVVPGSGFGQAPSTYHFRTTILPPEDKIHEVVDLLKTFHADFMKKYN
eukprot:gene6245-8603_t